MKYKSFVIFCILQRLFIIELHHRMISFSATEKGLGRKFLWNITKYHHAAYPHGLRKTTKTQATCKACVTQIQVRNIP